MKKLPGITTLITDADNTIYNWVEYIVPCLKAMVDFLQNKTGIHQDRIAESFKKIFEKYRTNEYPFVLQEADVFQDLRGDFARFQQELVTPTRHIFSQTRRKTLRLYPGVAKTMWKLINNGIRIIVLSDAPAFSAEQRLEHLDVSQYIWALYALQSYPLPEESLLDRLIINRIRAGYYRSRVGKVVQLPLEHEKPSTAGLRLILENEGITPDQAVLVGDNCKKDIRIAQEMGIANVWARYGTVISPEARAKLSYYSAASIQKRNVSQEGETSYRPTYTIDRFEDILPLLI